MDSKRPARPGGPREGDDPIRRNKLLALLPPEEMERVRPHIDQVDLEFRQSLYEDGKPNEHAFFPHSGVLSMVALPHGGDGLTVEVATVGNEGMVGLPLLLGGDGTPGECFCQVPGRAARIEARAFQELVDASPALRRVLLRYTQGLITQISQGSACNRTHPIEQRLARWLLMTHDRVGADHFTLTQEFLGQMLGVQRPSVSVAAGMLQKAGLIRYARGLVVIADREGLEAASCACYRVVQGEFDRLLR